MRFIVLSALTLFLTLSMPLAQAGDDLQPPGELDLPAGHIIIEGDIIVPESFLDSRSTYATNTWPGGVVPYEFNANVSATNRTLMRVAMDDWEARANISFVPRAGETNYVHIQSAGVNNSFVGMQTGGQIINIASWGSRIVIAHELAHALGFWHEHSRADRDTYIEVNYNNIQASMAFNFDIRPYGGEFGPYDFDSAMHYGDCAFSVCCSFGQECECEAACRAITVLPPNQEWQDKIGQLDHLSLGDAQGMGFLYGFDGPDCNDNHIRDDTDLVEGISEDCDIDGIPDECLNDCNANLIADDVDIVAGNSPDANGDGVPDECQQTRLFVRAAAAGLENGANWINAMTSLQRALRTAERNGVVTEIWVAAGTYTPETCVPSRRDSFILKNGVTLYGGFSGSEDPATFDLALRDFTANETSLSGDILGDDAPEAGTAENSYHVVSAVGVDETAVLDGFTITGGNADGSSPDDSGAGIMIVEGSPTLRHCIIRECRAEQDGAGLHCISGSPQIDRCSFVDNEGDWGVGCYFDEGSMPSITYSVFKDNWGRGNAGMYNGNGSKPYIAHCAFLDNYATNSISGMGNAAGSHAVITNTIFSGNLGGCIGNSESNPTITNCTFSENFSLFSGTMWNVNESYPVVANSIMWGNGLSEIVDSSGSTTLINCVVTGGWAGAGHGNTSLDPLLRDALGPDGEAGTGDEDLRLLPSSPGIDAGTNGIDIDLQLAGHQPLPSVDLEQHPRLRCGNVDLGAFESGFGDCNCDRVVNLDDQATLAGCLTGPRGGIAGDFDNDGTISGTDHGIWIACLAGPEALAITGCQAMDLNGDEWVDLRDFARLQGFVGSELGLPAECQNADLDADGDCDLVDFAALSSVLADQD